MTDPVSTDAPAALEFLTVAEVASKFRVKERTVYRWIEDGHLAHVKIGGTVRIPASAVPTVDGEEAS